MKLKSQFLSLSALLAMGMATTAWGADQTTTATLTPDGNGGYFVNMPAPLLNDGLNKITATLQIPSEVKTFKVYDDGGANEPFTTTKCFDAQCATQLILVPPEGYFIHLSGSLTSAVANNSGEGTQASFYTFDGTSYTDHNAKLIYATGTANDLLSWTRHEMLLEFFTTKPGENKWLGTNLDGLDLTIEVAMDIGSTGLASYAIPANADHLEMHASPTDSRVNKKTTLTSPEGTIMYLTFNDVLANGDTVIVLNGGTTSTDTLFMKTNATNNDVVYIPNNKATICVATNDDGLDDVLRAFARVVTKNVDQSVAGVDVYTVDDYKAAKLNDVEDGAISITSPIQVDAVAYDRVFTAGTPATIVLPFQLPAGATTNAKFYYLKEVTSVDCKWKATFRNITLDDPDALPAAHTPYAVIVQDDSELKFNLKGGNVTIETATIAEQYDNTKKWIFKGTYEYRTWNSGDEEFGIAYAIARDNASNYKAGDFVKIGTGASAAPMRAYIRKVDENVRLGRPLAMGEVSSIESLPEVIDVEFIDEDEKPMAIGRLNTVTGAIKINRWVDLKGRSTNHKPTTKGVFFNKKGIVK